jgi:hypothetical protein
MKHRLGASSGKSQETQQFQIWPREMSQGRRRKVRRDGRKVGEADFMKQRRLREDGERQESFWKQR